MRGVLLHVGTQSPAQRRQACRGGSERALRRDGALLLALALTVHTTSACFKCACLSPPPPAAASPDARTTTMARMCTRAVRSHSPAAALRSSAATPWNSTASSRGQIELGLVAAHCGAGGEGIWV